MAPPKKKAPIKKAEPVKQEDDLLTAETEGKVITTFVKVYPKKGKLGGPMLKITKEGLDIVERLAAINCPIEEISSFLRVAPNTLRNRLNNDDFEETYNRGKKLFRQSIRESQSRLIKRDNVNMSIFLGKNYLGQSDKSEIQFSEKRPGDMTIDELYAKLKPTD